MSSIKTILAALKTQYEAITLPAPFNAAPTVYDESQEDIASANLPAVVLFDANTQSITAQSTTHYQVSRLFYARLYTYATENNRAGELNTFKANTRDCVETIGDYFMLYSADNLDAINVMNHTLNRDSSVTTLVSIEGNNSYIGAVFEHLVTYIRTK